ncbi:MAG: hypothetical protein OXI17_03180 [Gammaproteobacteria bacterium]|nr:hypothetical protein [Gammaproteobacteria bacterium]
MGNFAEVFAGGAKNCADRPAAVVAILEYRVRKLHEIPHQIEPFRGIRVRDTLDDGPAQGIQFAREGRTFVPVMKRARAAHGGHLIPNFAGRPGRTLCAGKFKSEQIPDRGVAGADFHQQFGKSPRSEGFQVFCVECGLRGHVTLFCGLSLHYPTSPQDCLGWFGWFGWFGSLQKLKLLLS